MEPLLLLGCGILKKEICFLVDTHHWPIETFFLDSSLHVDFEKLQKALIGALQRHAGRHIIVAYGVCHPRMQSILLQGDALRTPVQNCVEMLLGKEVFTQELSQGAFFLLEDWAKRWDYVTEDVFGTDLCGMRELFQSEHRYLLCLTTRCSDDFSQEALVISQKTGLPLQWRRVDLTHLEHVLHNTLCQKAETAHV